MGRWASAGTGGSRLAASSDIRPWYRWHWHRYRTSSRVLAFSSIAVHGAYRNLLDAMWESGGTLSIDRNSLWRLALTSCKAEYEAVADEVEAMFERSEDGQNFTNATLLEEWNNTTEYLEKKRFAGGEGGRAKARNLAARASTPLADASKPLAKASTGLPSSSSSSSSSSTTEDQNLLSDETPDACAETVRKVFDYYREKIGKSAAYLLTPKRLSQGKARYRDAEAFAKQLNGVLTRKQLPAAAERLMRYAVDRLASDEWCNGANPGKKKYNDWDNAFRSTEKFSQWIEVEG